MTSAFIVTLDTPEVSAATLAGLAEQISESCQDDGLSVVSCVPYKHPTLGEADEGLSAPNPLGVIGNGLW